MELNGTITGVANYNTGEIFKGLPVKRETQIIEVKLDESFWQMINVKRAKIVIDRKQLARAVK